MVIRRKRDSVLNEQRKQAEKIIKDRESYNNNLLM